jgi:hypothetical protein
MKRMLPIAMLTACALLSFSLISNAQTIQATNTPSADTAAVNSVAVPPLTWPITGTYGAFTYEIQSTISDIKFYNNGSLVGTYGFIQEYPKQEWHATIDRNVIPGLLSVVLNIYGTPAQYNLTFWDL